MTPHDRIEKFVADVESMGLRGGAYVFVESVDRLAADLRALLDATKPKEPKPRRAYPMSEATRRVLRLMPKWGDSIEAFELHDQLGGDRNAVHQLLSRLTRKGLIVRPAPGHYSLPKAAP